MTFNNILILKIILFIHLFISSCYSELLPYFNTPVTVQRGENGICKGIVREKINYLIELQRTNNTNRCSLQIVMYELDDPDLLEDIVRAIQAGVRVEVLLDRGAYENKQQKIQEVVRSNPGQHETFKIRDKEKKERIKTSFEVINSHRLVSLIGRPYRGTGGGRPRTMHEKFAIFSCNLSETHSHKMQRKKSPSAALDAKEIGDEKAVDDVTETTELKSNMREAEVYERRDFEDSMLTGSYNWTDAASEINYENCLLIEKENHLIGRYKARFEEIKRLG